MGGLRLYRSDIRSPMMTRARIKNYKTINKCLFGGQQTVGEKIKSALPTVGGIFLGAGVVMGVVDAASPIYQNLPDLGNAVKGAVPLGTAANTLFFGAKKYLNRNTNLEGLLTLINEDRSEMSSSIVEVMNGLKAEDRKSVLADISAQYPPLYQKIVTLMQEREKEEPAVIKLTQEKVGLASKIEEEKKALASTITAKGDEIKSINIQVIDLKRKIELLSTPASQLSGPEKKVVTELREKFARGAQARQAGEGE